MRVEHEQTEARIAAHLDAMDLEGAATAALRGYGPSVLHYLRAMLGDDEATYEVFAELSEQLWKALPRFRREASVRTWVFKLAWTVAQDFRRRAARRRVRRLETTEASRIAAEIRSTTPAHQRDDAALRWEAIKACLGDEDRSLLLLRVEQRLSWREVADVMAMPEAALRKRFERLKARLRELAERHGVRSAAG